METISHLNQQLHDCQRQYTDLLTNKSMDTFNQTETKRQLTRLTEDKEKLEQTCEDLQVILDQPSILSFNRDVHRDAFLRERKTSGCGASAGFETFRSL